LAVYDGTSAFQLGTRIAYLPTTAPGFTQDETIGPLSPSPGNPYSLTFVATITPSAAAASGETFFGLTVAATPEPGLYGVLALGMIGLVVVWQRKRKTA
jgi:hypothetical protein